MPIDGLNHPSLDNIGQGIAAGATVILSPIVTLILHLLDNLECLRQALNRRGP